MFGAWHEGLEDPKPARCGLFLSRRACAFSVGAPLHPDSRLRSDAARSNALTEVTDAELVEYANSCSLHFLLPLAAFCRQNLQNA
jgi:hypothetical protein